MILEFVKLVTSGKNINQKTIGKFIFEKLDKNVGNELLSLWNKELYNDHDSMMIDIRGKIIIADAHEMFATHYYGFTEKFPLNFQKVLDAHGIFVDIAKVDDPKSDLLHKPKRIFYSCNRAPTRKQYDILKLLADLHQVKLFSVTPNYRSCGTNKAEFTTLEEYSGPQSHESGMMLQHVDKHLPEKHKDAGTVLDDIEAIREDYIPLTQWWHIK